MSLRTDYVDASFTGEREYELEELGDGTYHITDVTEYTQTGSKFGALDLNTINSEVNRIAEAVDAFPNKAGKTIQATASLDTTNSRLQMAIPEAGMYNTLSKLYATYDSIRTLIGLTAAKIAVGITIFGITGTYSGKGNATAADVRKGKTFSTASLNNATGTMAEKAAATYTPGTANQTIAAGQYLTGTQTIKGDSNLKAANIKKGVTLFGITGTWEGYVAAATDLYYNGANTAGFTANYTSTTASAYAVFETTYITIGGTTTAANSVELTANKSYNFAGYSSIIVTIKKIKSPGSDSLMQIFRDNVGNSSKIGEISLSSSNGLIVGGTLNATFSLENFQTTFVPIISIRPRAGEFQITRIRIS